jgi:peptidoglycan/xylan/chitin deacetylase (PgdA/CDA1 family)
MKIVSPLLKRVVYPSLAKTGIFRRVAGNGLAILTYHGVFPAGYEFLDPTLDGNLIYAETFRRQLRLLKTNYNVIAPEDMLAWCEGRRKFPPRAVLLTCDDGLLNHLTEMLPVLLEEKLRCLFFVTGASAGDEPATLWYEDLFQIFLQAPATKYEIPCGELTIRGDLSTVELRQTSWWNATVELSHTDAESRVVFVRTAHEYFGMSMNEACNSTANRFAQNAAWRQRFHLLTGHQLKQLADAGMTIGAHTMSHPLLSQQAPELAWKEIMQGRTSLESALGRKVWAFAYPFGYPQSVTPQVLAQTEEAGYKAAFMNVGGGLGADLPLYALPRVHVSGQMGLAELEAHLTGFHTSIQKWARRNGQSGSRVA